MTSVSTIPLRTYRFALAVAESDGGDEVDPRRAGEAERLELGHQVTGATVDLYLGEHAGVRRTPAKAEGGGKEARWRH